MMKLLCSTLSMLALAGCSLTLLPANVAPEVPMTHSVEQADNTLAQVSRERAETEARYAASEAVCYRKFFVNNCLDKAKEERRGKLVYLNALENEAQYFKRKVAVDERDRKLAQAQKDFDAEQARRAAEPAPLEIKPARAPRGRMAGRAADQAARAAKQAEKDRAKAAAAPAKIAAFEKQKAESLERQRKVAERKAEQARKQAAKEEAARVEAAKAAAAKPAAQ